ncbi:MAG: hypothetical protein ABI664_21640 [bacterium]
MRSLIVAGILACDGSGPAETNGITTVVPDDTPASITIAPLPPINLVAGTALTLSPTVRAADGHIVAVPVVTYVSSDATVLILTGNVITGGKAGTATITATSGAATATLPITVLSGTPSTLGISVQPVGGTTGTAFPVQPVVDVRDKGGNPITTPQYIVTASIASGGGTLTGTRTLVTAAGVARFTDLAITGVAGTRTLVFSAPGLTPVTSGDVNIAASPAPLLVIDTTAVSIAALSGTSQSLAIGIRNGGLAPLLGVTVDLPVYDPGQPTGWLAASIVGTSAPYSLALQVNATLPAGVYRAVVKVNAPGASNSPVPVAVTLTVSAGVFIAYGTNTEKLHILDVGDSYVPKLSATNGQGQPAPSGAVTYVSRATTVATVDAQGRITARGEGQTFVAALALTSADSVFVTVTRSPSGPVLRSNLTTYVTKAGDATFIDIYLDTKSTPVGAASVAIGYTTAVTVFTSVSITIPAGPPVPVVSSQTGGVYRVSVASATPLTGQVALLRLRVGTANARTSGIITLTVTEIVAPDGTDLLPLTTSTRIPIIVQ